MEEQKALAAPLRQAAPVQVAVALVLQLVQVLVLVEEPLSGYRSLSSILRHPYCLLHILDISWATIILLWFQPLSDTLSPRSTLKPFRSWQSRQSLIVTVTISMANHMFNQSHLWNSQISCPNDQSDSCCDPTLSAYMLFGRYLKQRLNNVTGRARFQPRWLSLVE